MLQTILDTVHSKYKLTNLAKLNNYSTIGELYYNSGDNQLKTYKFFSDQEYMESKVLVWFTLVAKEYLKLFDQEESINSKSLQPYRPILDDYDINNPRGYSDADEASTYSKYI